MQDLVIKCLSEKKPTRRAGSGERISQREKQPKRLSEDHHHQQQQHQEQQQQQQQQQQHRRSPVGLPSSRCLARAGRICLPPLRRGCLGAASSALPSPPQGDGELKQDSVSCLECKKHKVNNPCLW
ncbi:uncharacterized protein LOC144586222 [Pogona vitticeps]